MAGKKEGVPLVFIVGPTCSGKSDWALRMAESVSGAVLNADSVQFYEELEIGSAKPEFHKTPHIPHFLFQEAKAPEVLTAGDFRRRALKVLKKELLKRKIFITGGSGFYIQALEKGMFPLKPVPESILQALNRQKKSGGLPPLYKELQEKDPLLAQRISPNDSYRIIRAVSVIRSEGRKLTEIKKAYFKENLPWSYRKIGLSIGREELEKRIRWRVRSQLKKGLLEETEAFIKKGFQNWRPLKSLGYKECLLYFKGELKREDLEEEIIRRSLSLAKRQKTWFKKDKSIVWRDFKEDPLKVYREIKNL